MAQEKCSSLLGRVMVHPDKLFGKALREPQGALQIPRLRSG
jgi:hypothetical protein